MPSPAAVSRTIATDFLQTVVIVDDRADLNFSDSPTPGRTDSSLASKASDRAAAETEDGSATTIEDATPQAGLNIPSDDELSVAEHGDLDAKVIIDQFARLGLVCGVIRPEKSEEISPIVDPAARRADVLVLDWWMHGDGGAMSKEIISYIAHSDGHKNRIRLIIIYTAVRDLQTVAADVAGVLEGAEIVGSNRNRVVAGSVRIVVLAKPDTNVDPSLSEDVVSFGDFPDRVVTEFASAVEGLLSNVAFAALAAIRDNTHRILTRFDRSLDPAYLGHRMLLPSPEDSEGHLVELILQELSAVIDSASVGKRADYDAISQLVNDSVLVVGDVPKLVSAAARLEVPAADLAMHFVKDGVGSSKYELSRSERKDLRDWISRVFSLAAAAAPDVDADINEQWSVLMSSKLQYGATSPQLQLGVLVRDTESGRFMLCMQPVCDSVRLADETAFPFLPLEESEKSWDIALKYADKYHLLKLSCKIRDLSLIPFAPTPDSGGVVKAENPDTGEGWVFVPSASGRGSCEWVGELRDSFAHKFANKFAESISRVGAEDSEWFRLAK
jgi:hypothetical protein